MQLQTHGLVLHTTPYGETSVIARVLTRELGVQSYMVKGVRNARSRTKLHYFDPMTQLDMVVYHTAHGKMGYLREATPAGAPQPDFDPRLGALRFFMAEVLYRSLREDEPLPTLYDYTAALLGNLRPDPNIPIRYMLGVASHLGLEPMDNHSPAEPFFSLDEGRFVSSAEGLGGTDVIDLELSALLHRYLDSNCTVQAPLTDRNRLLEKLIDYYRIHLSTFTNFKSHQVLHSVLS
ncbi:MAG: recombination protein O N-terminal domain-containing protein [Bacteroidales bacterium]|nr:recombination protein O N-terminal domain-containing protein [Bacteroidales bacterium]